MNKPKLINEVLVSGGARLAALTARAKARSQVLDEVRAALPPQLKGTVVSAGLENGQLTIGVSGASWAARLRYLTDALRSQVGASLAIDIERVRIKVVPPRAAELTPPRA